MLLFFELDLPFNDQLQPACLDGNLDLLMKGQSECVIVGHQERDGSVQISQTPIAYQECWLEDDQHFCFKGKNKQLLTCKGDSGSPLLCRKDNSWTLVGIVTTVFERCSGDPTLLGIYNLALKIDIIGEFIESCIK